MAEFLVELYVARTDAAGAERNGKSARRAAEELTREGVEVQYVRSIFVPDDETCYLLFEARSADVVREAARRADLPFDRVAEAVGA
ncbi:MAG: nickel-binding protein [Gaiellaceae bacterium]